MAYFENALQQDEAFAQDLSLRTTVKEFCANALFLVGDIADKLIDFNTNCKTLFPNEPAITPYRHQADDFSDAQVQKAQTTPNRAYIYTITAFTNSVAYLVRTGKWHFDAIEKRAFDKNLNAILRL